MVSVPDEEFHGIAYPLRPRLGNSLLSKSSERSPSISLAAPVLAEVALVVAEVEDDLGESMPLNMLSIISEPESSSATVLLAVLAPRNRPSRLLMLESEESATQFDGDRMSVVSMSPPAADATAVTGAAIGAEGRFFSSSRSSSVVATRASILPCCVDTTCCSTSSCAIGEICSDVVTKNIEKHAEIL